MSSLTFLERSKTFLERLASNLWQLLCSFIQKWEFLPFILVVAVHSQRWRALKTSMGLNSQKGHLGSGTWVEKWPVTKNTWFYIFQHYRLKLSEGAVGVRHLVDNSENEAADGAPNRRSNHDKGAEWPEWPLNQIFLVFFAMIHYNR